MPSSLRYPFQKANWKCLLPLNLASGYRYPFSFPTLQNCLYKGSPMWAPVGVELQAQKREKLPVLFTGAAQHPSAGTLLADIQC